MNFKSVGIVVILSVLGLSHVVLGDEDVNPNKDYCEMVAEYKASNGEYGWPDYERKFNKVCLSEE